MYLHCGGHIKTIRFTPVSKKTQEFRRINFPPLTILPLISNDLASVEILCANLQLPN
jgi:hypothetical protein